MNHVVTLQSRVSVEIFLIFSWQDVEIFVSLIFEPKDSSHGHPLAP